MTWAIRTILTISLLALPLLLYLGLRLAASFAYIRSGSRRTARRVVAGVLVWFCLFPLLVVAESLLGMAKNRFDFVSGGPLVDYLLVYPFWVALIVAVELAPLFLVLDLASIAGRLRPSHRERWQRKLAIVRLALATAGVIFISAHAFIDTSHVRDTVIRTRIHNLPRQLEGLRMTVVGDVQVDRYTGGGKVDQLRRIVESRNPELLFSPGDVVTGGTDYVDAAMSAMCVLKGSVASFAVMGDHDYWSAPDAIEKRFRECRWNFLENEHRVLEYHGSQILVTGLTHIYSQRLNEPALDSILSRAPQADLRILLVHQPARVAHPERCPARIPSRACRPHARGTDCASSARDTVYTEHARNPVLQWRVPPRVDEHRRDKWHRTYPGASSLLRASRGHLGSPDRGRAVERWGVGLTGLTQWSECAQQRGIASGVEDSYIRQERRP